jgi:phosphohistidine phosphatase SixA
MVFYLVRHAHAGDKHAWNKADDLRPLSGSGWQEVAGLLTRLRASEITRVLSSPARRCVQTVDGLAAGRGLSVRAEARLGREARPEQLLGLVSEYGDGEAVVACSHGEVIGAVLTRLHRRGGPVPAGAEWPKGSVWILHTAAGVVTSTSYLPPLRIDDPVAYHG